MPKVTEAHVASRRRQILEAACRCFSRKGLHQTTIRDICDEAGLSTGAVYGHFKGKDEIIAAMAAMGRENTREMLFSSATAEHAPDALAQVLATAVRFFDSDAARESTRLDVRLWGEGLHAPRIRELFMEAQTNLTEPLADLVQRGQRDGDIAARLDPAQTARVLIALGLGLEVQKAMEPDVDLAGCSEVITAFLTGTFVTRASHG